MLPEEDYDTWAVIFTSSIEVGGAYTQLLDSMRRLVRDYAENGTLLDSLARYSDIFIDHTFPTSIYNIMKMGKIWQQREIDELLRFLSDAMDLVSWIILNGKESCFDSLLYLFDSNSSLHQSNRRMVKCPSIIPGIEICQQEEVSITLEEVIKLFHQKCNDLFVTGYHGMELCSYHIMFQILTKFSPKHRYVASTIFANLVASFGNHMAAVVRQYSGDEKALEKLDISHYKVIYKCFFDMQPSESIRNSQTSLDMLSFIILCMKCDVADKKLFGATNLAMFVEKAFQNALDRIIGDDFINELVAKVHHVEVLGQLKAIFDYLMRKKRLAEWHVSSLWATGRRYALTERTLLFDVVISLFKQFDKTRQVDFVNRILENLDETEYQILPNIISITNQRSEEVAHQILERLKYDIMCGQKAAEAAVLGVCELTLGFNMLKTMLNCCIEFLHSVKTMNFGKALFAKLIKECPDSKRMDLFNRECVQQLLDSIDEDCGNRVVLLDVISDFYGMQKHIRISADEISKLVRNPDDTVWTFLRQLMEKTAVTNADDKAMTEIVDAVKTYDFSRASESFVNLAIAVLHVRNRSWITAKRCAYAHGKQAVIVPPEFTIRYIHLRDHEMLIESFLHSYDEDGWRAAGAHLLKILASQEPRYSKEGAQKICNIAKQVLEEGSDETKIRILNLLCHYITKVEKEYDPEDFGFPRHCTSSDSITLTIKKLVGVQYTIHISPTKTVRYLRDRIGVHCERKMGGEGVIFRNDPLKDCKDLDRTLEEVGIKDGALIEWNDNFMTYNGFNTLPSLVVYETTAMTQLLLGCLTSDNDDLRISAQNLLELLPTDQTMANMFEDMKAFMENMKDSHPYIQKYMLEILAENLNTGDCKSEFLENDGLIIVSTIFLNRCDEHAKAVLNIMNMFDDFIDIECEAVVAQIIEMLRNIQDSASRRNISEISSLALKVIEKIGRSACDVSSIVMQNLEVFEWISGIDDMERVLPKFLVEIIKSKELYQYSFERMKESRFHKSVVIEFMTSRGEYISDDEVVTNFMLVMEPGSTVISKMCKIMTDRIASSSDLKVRAIEIVDPLLELAFSNVSDTEQKAIFGLILNIINENEEGDAKVVTFLRNIFSQSIDCWNYNPEFYQRRGEFTGLKNLRNTCFVNSVVQQMFHIAQFRDKFLTHGFEEGAELLTLRDLFIDMAYTENAASDPTEWLQTWHGWYGELIDVREQQDAMEFLQVLLDVIPAETSSMFKGANLSTHESAENNFVSTTTEPFWNISVTVRGYSDLETSLLEMIKDEVIDDYSIGSKRVSVRKFTKIKSAPDVLVVQLGRFCYQMATHRKYKVNDVFQFPDILDISPVVVDESEDTNLKYELAGMVCHTGTADHGHYFSLVRKGREWYKFNDNDVSKISRIEALDTAYGKTDGTSAYLLFYEKIGCAFEDFNVSEVIDLSKVRERNLRFRQRQAIFQKETLNFTMNCRDVVVLVEYLVNIFCHAIMNSECRSFEQWITGQIKSQEAWPTVIDYCVEHADIITNTLIHCVLPQNETILNVLVNIIVSCFGKSDANQCYLLCIAVINALKTIPTLFSHFPVMLKIVCEFLSVPRGAEIARENNMFDDLMAFLSMVYVPGYNINFYASMNFANLFRAAGSLVASTSTNINTTLVNCTPMIILAKGHSSAYIEFVFRVAAVQEIDIPNIMNAILVHASKMHDTDLALSLVSVFIEYSPEENVKETTIFLQRCEIEAKVPGLVVINQIQKSCERDSRFAVKLVKQLPDVISHLILAPDVETRSACERLFLSLFSAFKPVPGMPMYVGMREHPAHTEYAIEVLQKFDRCIQFIFDSPEMPTYLESLKGSMSDKCFGYVQLFRIWHFLAVGTNGLTEERFNMICDLINRCTEAKLLPDYHVLELLRFLFSYPDDCVNNVFEVQFELFKQNISADKPASYFVDTLNLFLAQMDRLDPATSERVLSNLISGDSVSSLINGIIKGSGTSDILNKVTKRVAKPGFDETIRASFLAKLSDMSNLFCDAVFTQWNTLQSIGCDYSGIVRTCIQQIYSLVEFMKLRCYAPKDENTFIYLHKYIDWLASQSDCRTCNFMNGESIDWDCLTHRCVYHMRIDVPKLIQWCCSIDPCMAISFMDNHATVFDNLGDINDPDNANIYKHYFNTYITAAAASDDPGARLSSLFETMKRSFVLNHHNPVVLSKLELLCSVLSDAPDSCVHNFATSNFVSYLLSQHQLLISSPELTLLGDLTNMLDSDTIMTIFAPFLAGIKDAVATGRSLTMRDNAILQSILESVDSADAIKQAAGITDENIGFFDVDIQEHLL